MAFENDQKLVYTVEQAARLLGLGRSGAYEAVRRGDLPAIRVGKRLIIPKTALDRMLAQAGQPSKIGD